MPSAPHPPSRSLRAQRSGVTCIIRVSLVPSMMGKSMASRRYESSAASLVGESWRRASCGRDARVAAKADSWRSPAGPAPYVPRHTSWTRCSRMFHSDSGGFGHPVPSPHFPTSCRSVLTVPWPIRRRLVADGARRLARQHQPPRQRAHPHDLRGVRERREPPHRRGHAPAPRGRHRPRVPSDRAPTLRGGDPGRMRGDPLQPAPIREPPVGASRVGWLVNDASAHSINRAVRLESEMKPRYSLP